METIYTNHMDNGSVRVLGSQIRKQRKRLHISQAQLAEGICTQGMVSLIENRSLSPSIDIIYKICERLGMNIQELIAMGKTANKRLDRVEKAIWDRQYDVANQLIQKVVVNNLANRELKSRYYCYLGDINFKLESDYEAAVNHFNEVLLKYSGLDKPNLYTTWAHIGIAKSYLMLNNRNQADQFNELAISYLKLHPFSVRNNFKLLVNMYVESIDLHHQLLKHEEAVMLNKVACQFLRSVDSMYRLGALNLAMARSLIALNAKAKALNYLDQARLFGTFNNEQHIVSQVNKLSNLVTE